MSPARCPPPPDHRLAPGHHYQGDQMRTVRLRLHVPNQSARDVYAALADFERYPILCEAVQDVAVTEVAQNRTVSRWEVTFRAGLLRWTEEDTFEPGALTITFRQ